MKSICVLVLCAAARVYGAVLPDSPLASFSTEGYETEEVAPSTEPNKIWKVMKGGEPSWSSTERPHLNSTKLYTNVPLREEQCAAFNNKTFCIPGMRRDVKWVPKYGGIHPEDRCMLYCRVAHSGDYYLLKEKVADGTVCGPDTDDICVDGVCRAAGCDHVLGSNTRLDYCGVCGGDNSSCQQVTGSYNTSQYGYSTVLRVPAGSSNVDVRQHGFRGSYKDDNYLALMDGETGEYVLNGNSVVSMFRKLILYRGTVLEYTGSDKVVERINCSKPLTKDLIIQVLSVGNLHPPNITYSYAVPRTFLAQYSWRISDKWTECDKVCNGERRRRLVCIQVESGQEVTSDMCNGIEKPVPPTENCNDHCDPRLQISRSE